MPDKDGFDDFIEAFGGVEQMFKIGDDCDRRFRLLYGRVLELMEEHPRQWVALAEGDVWVFADSHEELLRRLKKKGLRSGFAVIKYLDPEPPILILAEEYDSIRAGFTVRQADRTVSRPAG